ncbi:MAG: hypothetical protein K8R23_04670 [Chthoniobacter sp.]|nr:hypothetical protein [Chthoniobacter sp.]
MNYIQRGLLAAGLITTASVAEIAALTLAQPQPATDLAIAQVNGGNPAWHHLLAWQAVHQWPTFLAEAVTALTFAWWVKPYLLTLFQTWSIGRTRRLPRLLPLVALAFTLGGCVKSYDKPEYVEIDTSDTGFLIPLEGDSAKQARFESVDYLQERKVAAKRIQITHRWNQEGRLSNDGRWLPVVRLVKVNRSPLTREWTAEGKHNAGDKAIWIESADSVGFSMGFTCTAFIDEKDAATFLYWYPSGSLATVMDSEMRGRIQQTSAEVAAKYPLDLLRSKKQEIADAVKQDVTGFFAQRGITVTTVGMFGGMTYENAAIQKAIDDTVIAQQLKVVSEAKFSAQQRENDRIELEAKATAEKHRLEAKGRSDARLAEAEAEAKASIAKAQAESQGIRLVNEAVAGSNPMLLQMRQLDVEKTRIERWNGAFPQMMLGTNPNILFTSQLPALSEPKR